MIALAALLAASVTGRVVDGAGAPVADVELRLYSDFAETRLTTDAKGEFNSPPLRDGDFALRVCKRGFATFEQNVSLPAKKRMRLDVTLLADPAAQGCPREDLQLVPYKPGAAQVPIPRITESELPTNPRVEVKPAADVALDPVALVGTARSAKGPLAGARVRVRHALEEVVVAETTTDASGAYAVRGLPPSSYDVELTSAEGNAVRNDQTPFPGSELRVDLTLGELRGAVHVHGVVRDQSGKPIARAAVEGSVATVDWGAPSTPAVVHSGADGRYDLFVPNIGHAIIHARSADGRSGEAQSGDIWLGAPDASATLSRDVEVRETNALKTCRGIVLGLDGKPAAGATVSTHWSRSSPDREDWTVTGADGHFALGDPDSAVVRARLAGAAVSGECAAGLQLSLRRGATLIGNVTSHLAVGELSVGMLARSDRGRALSITAEPYLMRREFDVGAARFRLPNLAVGEPVELWFFADHGRRLPVSVVLPREGAFQLELSLDATSAVRAQTVTAKGRPVAALVCRDEPPKTLADCTHAHNGQLSWTRLPPGRHVLHFYAPNANPWRTPERSADRAVEVLGGEELDLGIVTVPAGRGNAAWSLRDADGIVTIHLVAPDGPAARAGLEVGMRVLAVNGTPVKTEREVRDLLGDEDTVATVRAVSAGGEPYDYRVELEGSFVPW